MNNFNIAISTVNKISQVLKIKPPQVYLNDVQDFPNPHVSSMYVSSKDAIVFNSSWIDQVDVMEVVATAIHETRHAYQSYCVTYNIYEDEKTIQLWKDSLKHYEKPIESLDTKEHIDYLNQPIEIDAIAFSYYIMLDWFEVKLVIPEQIKEKVLRIKNALCKKNILKISISNDDIIAHLKYGWVTKTSSDFDIEIASIKRDVFVNLCKKFIKKSGALSDN